MPHSYLRLKPSRQTLHQSAWRSLTANSTRYVGTDTAGTFYDPGTAVVITRHGETILTPDRIRQLLEGETRPEGSDYSSFPLSESEIDGILSAKEGIFKYEEFVLQQDLPPVYTVVLPLETVREMPKEIGPDTFSSWPLFVIDVGGMDKAGEYRSVIDENHRYVNPFSFLNPSDPQSFRDETDPTAWEGNPIAWPLNIDERMDCWHPNLYTMGGYNFSRGKLEFLLIPHEGDILRD